MPSNIASYPDKQPKQLSLLFFTELWERFGFYTLQTIFILYLTKSLGYADHKANVIYAALNGLLYLTPAIGGYIADRYIGFQRAIILGGILLTVAYFLTAVPNEQMFFLGLSTLIVANGLFKPNVSSIVGTLYGEDDPRRDGGFTIFYMGINIGSLIPPLIAGAIVVSFGWHAGFLLAAIGMTIGLITFLLGKKSLGEHGAVPAGSVILQGRKQSFIFHSFLYLGIAADIALGTLIFKYPETTDHLIEIATVIILLVTFGFILREAPAQRKKMIASLILICISIGFWALYNQTFTSLMLFADRNMDKHMLGVKITTEMTQFFNPFYIIALSPVLSSLWVKLSHKKLNPSIPMKFALGVLFMVAGFLVLAIASRYHGLQGMTSAWWLASSYLLQTIGELLLSPIGLSMITVLSPPNLVGMMMGVWFFAQAAAFAVGGSLANIAEVPAHLSATASLKIYGHAFTVFTQLCLILAVISFLLVPILKRMIAADDAQPA